MGGCGPSLPIILVSPCLCLRLSSENSAVAPPQPLLRHSAGSIDFPQVCRGRTSLERISHCNPGSGMDGWTARKAPSPEGFVSATGVPENCGKPDKYVCEACRDLWGDRISYHTLRFASRLPGFRLASLALLWPGIPAFTVLCAVARLLVRVRTIPLPLTCPRDPTCLGRIARCNPDNGMDEWRPRKAPSPANFASANGLPGDYGKLDRYVCVACRTPGDAVFYHPPLRFASRLLRFPRYFFSRRLAISRSWITRPLCSCLCCTLC